uniref:Protein kinase domain-containing protein n=1 Tax=Salix viminalis TaxID=40686 RepID=A0A6N2NFR6_SALVM
MAVAVKVLNLLRKGAPKSFMAECAALVNIRHRNLVRVVSSCSSIDFLGNDFKAIVYELMVNGSLEEWLHPLHQPNNAQEMRCLNLIQKLNISIDVANALNYLHQHCETPVVHCDLKPSNTSSIGLKGTIGYAAPEYGVGSDMFTGKRPTDDMFKDGLNLHSYAKDGRVSEVVEPTLLREDATEPGNNSLSSSIPGELGRLFRLQMLRLGNNLFSGEIPANISSCANLIALRLEGNNLTGKLPEQLESLSKLKVLDFESNNLVGEIPPSFGNLSSIVEINGMRNDLKGYRAIEIRNLFIRCNNLSGTIPPSIFNLSTLTGFAVPVNQLHGTLPPDLGHTLPNLETLLVHTNRFSGLIPMTISNASNLSAVELGDNFFTGKIPSLGSLPNLWFLSIGHNYLGSGQDDDLSFLYSLENNTVLEVFDVYANHLGGVLPEILGNFSKNLRIMAFGRNQIRGTIPDGISSLLFGLESNQLGGMIPSSIDDNKISGSIPSSVGNMTSLIGAHLDLNNLHGSIPSNLGNCRNLLALGLSNNNLSGSIPKELLNIPSGIFSLNLSENHLTGSLPLEVGNLVHLGELDVSKNRLSGEIPHSLGSCASLELLSLKGNSFKGSIPESLLREHLSQVPVQGAFGNASVISMAGNKKLCGGIPQLNLSRCTTSAKLKSSTKILIATMSGGLLVVILVASSVLFYCFRKTKDNQGSSTSSWGIQLRRVAYQDLLLATNGFSSASLIGVGSFGSVYRGILPPDWLCSEGT